jgi:hypothetical protein
LKEGRKWTINFVLLVEVGASCMLGDITCNARNKAKSKERKEIVLQLLMAR